MLDIIQEIRGNTPEETEDTSQKTSSEALVEEIETEQVPEEIATILEEEIYDVQAEADSLDAEGEFPDTDEIEEADEVQSPEELAKLGLQLVRQGELGEGIALLEQAVILAPEKAEAHFNLGIAYTLQEAIPNAMLAYQKALEIDPLYLDAKRMLTGMP